MVVNPAAPVQPFDLARATIEHQFFHAPAPPGYQPSRPERPVVAPDATPAPVAALGPAVGAMLDARYVNRQPKSMSDQPAYPSDTPGQREAARDAESLHAEDAAAQERRKLERQKGDRAFRESIGATRGRSADTPSRSPAKRAEEWLRAKARRRGEYVPPPPPGRAARRSMVKLGIDATDVGADPGPG